MQNSKRLIHNTTILTFRMLVTIAISFYTSRLILQALGIEDFGVYNVVCGVSSMITVISNSLTEGVNRFITVEVSMRDEQRINKMFALSNTALLIISALFLLLSETIGLYLFYQLNIPVKSQLSALWVYQLSVVGMIVSFNGIPYVALITAYEKFGFYGLMSIVETLMRLAVTVCLFVLPSEQRLIGYGIGLLLVLLSIRVLYLLYVLRLAPFIRYRFSTDKSGLSILGQFTGYKFLWEFANACGTQGVNIVLNFFFGPLLNAARGVAFQVQNIIYKLLLNFQTPLRPQIIKSYTEGDSAYYKKLVLIGVKFSFFVMSLLIIPVAVESKSLLSWWLGYYPAHSEVIVTLLCFECLFYSAFMPLEYALDAQGDIRGYKIGQSLVYFAILPLTYFCFSFGAAYYIPFSLSIFAQLVITLLRITMICPKVGLNRIEIAWVIVRLIVLFVPCLSVVYFVAKSISLPLLSLITVCIVNTVLFSVAMYFLCLNREEQLLLVRQLNKVVKIIAKQG